MTNHLTSLRIGERLESIEIVLSPWQSIFTTPSVLSTPLNFSNVHTEAREAAPFISRPSIDSSCHSLASLNFDNTSPADSSDANLGAPSLLRKRGQSLENSLSPPACLASTFEMGPTFRPETYTNPDIVPTVFGYNYCEVEGTQYTRLNQCAIFFRSQVPRTWKRLTVSITSSVESIHWDIGRVRSSNEVEKASDPLPIYLATLLETFLLRSQQEFEQDSHLGIFLGNQSDLETRGQAPKVPIKIMKPHFQAESYLQQITRALRYWDCPRYSERELIEQPLSRQLPNNEFVANLRSRWVFELRFGSDKSQIDSHLYTLQVLQCLRGVAGIAPFLGLVLGNDNSTVSGFLCELPAKGALSNVLSNAKKSGQPITWDQCAKWCRQIIQAVAEVHSKGFVVGSLAELEYVVAIDADDNAVLYRHFRNSFRYNGVEPAILPPEYCRSTSTIGPITALPHTDIYQLGLLLWRIAADEMLLPCPGFCRYAGCTTKADTICAEPHVDPAQLPSPGEDIPQYLRDIIAACRAESPDERLPAWKLLEMFPPMAEDKGEKSKGVGEGGILHLSNYQDISVEGGTVEEHTSQQRSQQPGPRSGCTPTHSPRLEEYVLAYENVIACDFCKARTTPWYFHCSVCHSGDYDICPRCFFQGAHCLEHDHYSLEYSEGNTKARYHTSVKETGQRDVLIV